MYVVDLLRLLVVSLTCIYGCLPDFIKALFELVS